MKKSIGARPLAFPLPAFLVGSYDESGQANIMTAAWGGIVSSDPPCLAVSIRPSRHSYEAVIKNKAFTVSIPNSRLAAAADYAGLVSGKNHDKFKEAGLTAVKSEVVNAPYVSECPVVIECKLIETLVLGVHTLCVGEIMDVKADENVIGDGPALDIAKVDPIIFNSGGDYHQVGASVGKAFSIGKTIKG